MKRLTQGFAALVLAFYFVTSAQAASQREEFHFLAVGAGVSTPSVLDGLRDNAAIHHAHQRFSLQVMGMTSSTNLNPTTAGAHLMAGTGFVGGQAGFETGIPGLTSPTLRAGLGFEIPVIRLAMGVACSATLVNGIAATCNQVGLLFNARGPFRIGAQITSLTLPLPVGFGLAVDLGQIVTLAVDSSTTFGSNMGMNLIPALGIRLGFIQLSGGYGFPLLQGNYPLANGLRLGGNIVIGKLLALSFHYNHDSLMHAMLTLRF